MTKFAMPLRVALSTALTIQSVHAAQAQTVDCMPAKEAEALFLTIGPTFVNEMVKTCTGVLAADSYLLRSGPDLVKRIKTAAAGREDEAVAAFKRFGDGELDGMETEAVLPLVRDTMGVMIAKDLSAKNCGGFDAIFAQLDPLPAANLAGAIVAIVQLVDADRPASRTKHKKKSGSDFDICPLSTKP